MWQDNTQYDFNHFSSMFPTNDDMLHLYDFGQVLYYKYQVYKKDKLHVLLVYLFILMEAPENGLQQKVL